MRHTEQTTYTCRATEPKEALAEIRTVALDRERDGWRLARVAPHALVFVAAFQREQEIVDVFVNRQDPDDCFLATPEHSGHALWEVPIKEPLNFDAPVLPTVHFRRKVYYRQRFACLARHWDAMTPDARMLQIRRTFREAARETSF